MTSRVQYTPDDCRVGDLVEKKKLSGFPKMSGMQATNFRRYTGTKHEGDLVRFGNKIFDVGEAELARCLYDYPRDFSKC